MQKRRVLETMGEGISHGGEEALIDNIITHIDMEGLSIDWMTPYECNNMKYKDDLTSRGGNVFALGATYKPGKSRYSLVKPLNRFFSEHHYDVVHIHSGSTSSLALIARAAYQHGTKKIIVHSHLANNSFRSKLIRIAYSHLLKKYPTNYMACSFEAARTKFPRGVESKVQLINNGIELEQYAPNDIIRERIRDQLNIPQNSKVIGHVGRFSSEKNHKLILRSFKDVIQDKDDCYLLLIGDGPLYEEIQQMAEDLQIEKWVRFAGYVNNVSDYYKAMDLFVLPSVFEGFAIVLIEAQATGIPCLISDTIPDIAIVNSNVYRLSIEAQNASKWAEAIGEHLSERPVNQRSLLVNKGFDIKDTAEQIRTVYMEGYEV